MFWSCAGPQNSGGRGRPLRANRHLEEAPELGTTWFYLQEAAGMAAQERVGVGRGGCKGDESTGRETDCTA